MAGDGVGQAKRAPASKGHGKRGKRVTRVQQCRLGHEPLASRAAMSLTGTAVELWVGDLSEHCGRPKLNGVLARRGRVSPGADPDADDRT
jgi:hypothetical protein